MLFAQSKYGYGIERTAIKLVVLWTIIVINLANAGFTLSLSEQFLLIALPNLIGSALRIPYTFRLSRATVRNIKIRNLAP